MAAAFTMANLFLLRCEMKKVFLKTAWDLVVYEIRAF